MIFPENFETKVGFDTIRARLRELCHTEAARERVDEIKFQSDYPEIDRRQRSVAEMCNVERSPSPVHLDGATDMRETVASLRLDGRYPSSESLSELRRNLRIATDARHSVIADDSKDSDEPTQTTPLRDIANGILPLKDVLRLIDRLVDDDGALRDSASQALADLRGQRRRLEGSASAAIRRIADHARKESIIEADATASVRDGRLVLPVPAMNRRRIPGIVHDQSATGKTVFVEPSEVVEINNRLRTVLAEENRECIRILREAASELRPQLDEIAQTLYALYELDFVCACARYALSVGAVMPVIETVPAMEWYGARNPVLAASLQAQGKEVVPLDISLHDTSHILVISGPNAGGKSVALKTVALLQYMAQCGLHVPMADNSHVGIFTDIMIDIGDNQSMTDDLSTYSSHLRSMKMFLKTASPSSLVMIDEFGAGTEPHIGGAIAQAILGQLLERGAWGVINTHYQNLKRMATETPGIKAGSMLYDRHHLRPLYRLAIGQPGSSYALDIAASVGLPTEVVDKARELAGSDYVDMDKYLSQIARDRAYWQRKREEIHRREGVLEQKMAATEERAEELREGRRRIMAEAREEATRILDDSNALIERTIADIRRHQADKQRTREARERLRQEREELHRLQAKEYEESKKTKNNKSKNPQSGSQGASAREDVNQTDANLRTAVLSPGAYVVIDGGTQAGRILELEGSRARVAMGSMVVSVELSRLRVASSAQARAAREAGRSTGVSIADVSRRRSLDFAQEIDVRGMRLDEALQAVSLYVDDAVQFGAQRVRILHGTGTGALRQGIRTLLGTRSDVSDFHDEDVRLGGAGITVVNL